MKVENLDSMDYNAALDKMYEDHYCGGICPHCKECFASATKKSFLYRAKEIFCLMRSFGT